jgi:DNA-binding FadR family transcriptional regulator
MGVGRASVREALGWLQVRGLIETRPGAGSYVVRDVAARLGPEPGGRSPGAPLPAADASPSALLQARLILEPAVARLAAARRPDAGPVEELLAVMEASTDAADPAARARWSDADRRFHRQVAAAAGNPVLLALADHVAALMDEPLWRRLRDESITDPGHTVLQLAEHRLIWAAIAEGDPGRRRAARRPAPPPRAPLHGARLTPPTERTLPMTFPGIIPAVITPFDAEDRVDVAALEANVAHLLERGVHGLIAAGTMGEAGSLTQDGAAHGHRDRRARRAGAVPVLAGVSAGATRPGRGQHAARAGGRGAGRHVPAAAELRGTPDEHVAFFAAVAPRAARHGLQQPRGERHRPHAARHRRLADAVPGRRRDQGVLRRRAPHPRAPEPHAPAGPRRRRRLGARGLRHGRHGLGVRRGQRRAGGVRRAARADAGRRASPPRARPTAGSCPSRGWT